MSRKGKRKLRPGERSFEELLTRELSGQSMSRRDERELMEHTLAAFITLLIATTKSAVNQTPITHERLEQTLDSVGGRNLEKIMTKLSHLDA